MMLRSILAHSIGVRRISGALLLASWASLAEAQRGMPEPRAEPLDSVFPLVGRLVLKASDSEPLGRVQAIDVRGNSVFVVDGSNGNVKVFDLTTGVLRRTMGRAGDGPGEMRRVIGIVVAANGAAVTMDWGRQVLARWDSTGHLSSEQRIPGQWNGVAQVELPTETHLLLSGRTGVLTREGGIPVDSAPPILHEVGTSGILRSSVPVAWPRSSWQRSFTNHVVAASGSVLAIGGYASDVVQFRDWSTGREWADTLRAPWLKPIAWPPNDQFGTGSKMTQMREWLKAQTLVNRVYVGSPTWYLAQIQMYDGAGQLAWGYILSGLDGLIRAVTIPTSIDVMALRGDILFALVEDDSGEYVLERRRVRPSDVRPRARR